MFNVIEGAGTDKQSVIMEGFRGYDEALEFVLEEYTTEEIEEYGIDIVPIHAAPADIS